MEIEFKIEIDSLLKELFFESWMDDDDWNQFLKAMESEKIINYQEMSDQIKIGISNGYSLNNQINKIKN